MVKSWVIGVEPLQIVLLKLQWFNDNKFVVIMLDYCMLPKIPANYCGLSLHKNNVDANTIQISFYDEERH